MFQRKCNLRAAIVAVFMAVLLIAPTVASADLYQMLKSDSQMRAAFINKIAAPIANKMFECGMIP